MQPNCSKSTESLYSTTSSKYSASAAYTRPSNLQIRKGVSNGNVARSGEVRQRVLSARRLRMKTLQNQLADAQLHIAELAQENRILRTLHKRQDNALSKYENTSAELPQLLHSHAEEIRVWQTKYKNLQNQNRELACRLKQKDGVILNISDQNKHLTQLNNDKSLEDRERLTERVRFLEQRLNERDNEMKLMARRLQLEKKSFKNQLQSEHSKYKDLMVRLEKSKTEITKISKLDPLGIADKLAKVSILPKPSRGRESKNNETDLSTPSLDNDMNDDEPNFRATVIKNRTQIENKIGDEKHEFKTNVSYKSRNRSVSPKSERDADLNTPSPITMRRKSSLERKKIDDDKKIKPKTIENAFEMNIASLKDEYDEVSLTSSEGNLKDYSKWQNSISNRLNEKDEYDYKNRFENDENQDNEIDDIYEDDDYNEVADVIETSDYPPRSNKDVSDIKKQIMNDYENRENFLDTFCRDSSLEAIAHSKDDFKKAAAVDSKKKTKLLAALKAIDETGSKEST